MKRLIFLATVITILVAIKLLTFNNNDMDGYVHYNNPDRPYVLGAP